MKKLEVICRATILHATNPFRRKLLKRNPQGPDWQDAVQRPALTMVLGLGLCSEVQEIGSPEPLQPLTQIFPQSMSESRREGSGGHVQTLFDMGNDARIHGDSFKTKMSESWKSGWIVADINLAAKTLRS